MDLSNMKLTCPHCGNEAFKIAGQGEVDDQKPFACGKCGEVTPYMGLNTESGDTLQECVNQMAAKAFRGMFK